MMPGGMAIGEGGKGPRGAVGAGQLAFEFDHRPSLLGEDFLVAPCNAEAIGWIDRWPDWPAPALAIWGPSGCGKTHLVRVWQARSGAHEIGLDRLIETSPVALLDANVLCAVEDAGAALADPEASLAFLHLFNLVAAAKGHMMLTAETPPARWAIELADLSSRLAAIPAVEVKAPDDGLIAALLVKLFADRQLGVGADVVAYMVARMERSFGAARSLVAAIDRAALSKRRNVTVPLVGEVMRRQSAPIEKC
jgi:chromosomal replication initiation ATPase DnaA